MALTDTFRRQHEEIVQLLAKLDSALNVNQLASNATATRSLLSQLAGIIKAHLSMEDRSLYPKMLASTTPEIVAAAKRYSSEMGAIAANFTTYLSQWPTADAIQKSPADFVKTTRDIAAKLGKRIEAEEQVLYALADRA